MLRQDELVKFRMVLWEVKESHICHLEELTSAYLILVEVKDSLNEVRIHDFGIPFQQPLLHIERRKVTNL